MKYYKNYETYNDSLLSPHNPNGDGYTEPDGEPEEINYDNPDPPEEEPEPEPDLLVTFFKQILSSF